MDIASFLKSVVDPLQAQTLAYGIGLNLILGIIAALVKGEFELNRLKDFGKRVVVTFGSYVAVAIAAKAVGDFEPLRTAAWLALSAFLVAQIVGNLKELGLPIPKKVRKFIEKDR